MAADFFTIEAWNRKGSMRLLVLFIIDLSGRRVEIARLARSLLERRFAIEGAPRPNCMSVPEVRAHISEITEPLLNLPQASETLPSPFQRRFQHFLKPVRFTQGKSGTAELGPVFRTSKQLATANSSGVGRLGGLVEPGSIYSHK